MATLCHPVVLWCLALLGPVHQQQAWCGRTWHLAPVTGMCVCASGVARISTDGFLHTMRVQRRFVVFISIHIYYIPCIVPGRAGAEDSKHKPWLWKFNSISNAMKEWCRKVHQWMRKWLWRCWWHEAKTMTRNNWLTWWRNERLNERMIKKNENG